VALARGEVMGAILPKPPSEKLSGEGFLVKCSSNLPRLFGAWVQSKSENCKLATSDDWMWQQETLMLVRLRTRDPDELAEGFRPWGLRFRQLGGGSFRGQLKLLRLGRIQVVRASGNRRLHAQGSLPPGSFGFAPVLPRNEAAIWRGRRCKTGQVVTLDPAQEADHVTAADFEFVSLTVDGDFFRQCAAVPGGFDPEERLAGRLAITPSPACCRALTDHLTDLLDQVEARPDLFIQPQARQALEQGCVRRVVEMIAQSSGGDRTECWSSKRERLVRRADDCMRARLGGPLALLELCRELGVSERALHYAFQEVRGLSPMAYFRASRLNAVRQELKAAAGTATVREVAQRWGFRHTGEFAAAYRRLFGELPSQTLNG
jgi:AraC family ethanolamine operon transcriptional activator